MEEFNLLTLSIGGWNPCIGARLASEINNKACNYDIKKV
jgi:hypothetical protein